ncbi:hypothetical protein [Streptomyces celluloflavus]|uniref:hypothetical protein n=1 Tax=Streptomyces celluloflavus TaxID=58344 RepID=UPI0036CF8CE1
MSRWGWTEVVLDDRENASFPYRSSRSREGYESPREARAALERELSAPANGSPLRTQALRELRELPQPDGEQRVALPEAIWLVHEHGPCSWLVIPRQDGSSREVRVELAVRGPRRVAEPAARTARRWQWGAAIGCFLAAAVLLVCGALMVILVGLPGNHTVLTYGGKKVGPRDQCIGLNLPSGPCDKVGRRERRDEGANTDVLIGGGAVLAGGLFLAWVGTSRFRGTR